MSNSTSNKRIVKNTLFLYIRSAIILFVSLYTSRILLSALGQSDFGLNNVVAGFVTLFSFLNASMINSIQRYLSNALGKDDLHLYHSVFRCSLAIQIVLSLIILLLGETIGLWFVSTKLNIPAGREQAAFFVYQFAILSFVFKVFLAPFSSVIISREKMNFFSIQGILEAFFLLLICFIVKYSTRDRLVLYAILLSLSSLCILVMNAVYVMSKWRELDIKPKWNKEIITEMASFSGWNLFGSFSSIAKSQGINIILNIFFDVVVNAARGISMQVLNGVNTLIYNFQTAFQPQLMQSYAEGNMERYRFLTFYGSKISFFIMWLLALPIILSITPILDLWLGMENVPEYTAEFTIIVLLTGLVETFASPIAMAVYAHGNIKWFQIIVSTVKILVIPFAYFSCLLFGNPIYALLASLLLEIFAQATRLFIWKKLVNISIRQYFETVLLPAILVASSSFAVCFLLFSHIDCEGLSKIILSVFVSWVSIVGFVIAIGLSKAERSQLKIVMTKQLMKFCKHNK